MELYFVVEDVKLETLARDCISFKKASSLAGEVSHFLRIPPKKFLIKIPYNIGFPEA
jgi:hypothetical protein